MKLADNLKIIRKENNLSQEQLAERLNVSRQAVSKWESGQSYPEMDKVLLICKLFNYNIDELMNENIKEVEESKQSNINFNKAIQNFFDLITKLVDMITSMSPKQIIKCLLEQIVVCLFILLLFSMVREIICSVISGGLIGVVSNGKYYTIMNIIDLVYSILALIIGIIIFLHIFKIRYLNYYEIVRKDEEIKQEDNDKQSFKNIFNNVQKKEKIIIRDPEHSESKFLSGIAKLVLLSIKAIAIFFAVYFVFIFVGAVALFVLSFLIIKSGILFIRYITWSNFYNNYKLYYTKFVL